MSDALPSSRGVNFAAAMNVYAHEPGYLIAVRGPVMIQIIRSQSTLAGVSATNRAFTEMVKKHSPVGFIIVLEPTANLRLPPDIRKGVDGYVKRFTDYLAGAAIVFEGNGFHATLVRSLVTAVNLASSAQHPTKVCGDVETGATWLEGCLGPGGLRPGQLLTEIENLRTFFHRQAANDAGA